MILGDFLKALEQAFDPAFRRVLIRSVLLTLALLGPFVLGSAAFLGWIVPDQLTIPFVGTVTFVDTAVGGVGLVVLLFLSSFLMIPVAAGFIGLFLEEIADAVEDRWYPGLGDVPRMRLTAAVIESLRFLLLFLLVNALALVIYLMSTVLAPFVFWIANGILIGREYFQLVAMRRLGRAGADRLRRRHRLQIWIAGTLMAVPLTIPVLNLVVPILGVATFTHLFHRLNGDVPSSR